MLKNRRKQSDVRNAGRSERLPVSKARAVPAKTQTASPEERRRMVAEAAYFRAERRGFAPGQELEDWIHAEAEIDRLSP